MSDTPIFYATTGAVMADQTFPCSMATCLDLIADDIRCQHGNDSGACSECRNGVDPTTGDVA